jgi:hypothetical protein
VLTPAGDFVVSIIGSFGTNRSIRDRSVVERMVVRKGAAYVDRGDVSESGVRPEVARVRRNGGS